MKKILSFIAFVVFSVSVLAAPTLVLTWTDNSDNEDGFRIERRVGATGTWVILSTTAKDISTYTDAGPFTTGTSYTYRVLAFNAWGDSAWSNEAGVETRTPGASGNLKISIVK